MLIDLRSDTFTLPVPGMREAMLSAPLGDDVFSEDPTVNALEAKTAALFGMEAAVFCPSGTMTNQIAIKCHTEPGNEMICDKTSHVYIYEAGGIAFHSGCQVRALEGHRGRITASGIEECINPDDVHRPETRLVSLENTTNRGGGACYDDSELQRIRQLCDQKGLRLHLDGARLWNALVARKEDPRRYGALFDSISVCLSKGLGAPVGSLLLGRTDWIRKARRVRKLMGGGMRQAGILAAAGLYALDHHRDRLEQDHLHARMIESALAEKSFVTLTMPVETNILIFDVHGAYTPRQFAEYLKERGVLCIPISATQVRMVTHLGVEPRMIDHLNGLIRKM